MHRPDFKYEKMIWGNGFRYIGGIDEVGRGAIAGPVVAGCVVYEKRIVYKLSHRINKYVPDRPDIKIDDSKRLTSKQRDLAEIWIKNNCLSWGVGEVTAQEIDRIGIVKATQKAMRKAIGNANQRYQNRIEYLLIDAFYLPYIRDINMPSKSKRIDEMSLITGNSKGRQKAIIEGDQKCFSIASASIIAKVYRDNLMTKLGSNKKNIKYGWNENKGYGTLFHRKKIIRYGTTRLHRKTFILKNISR